MGANGNKWGGSMFNQPPNISDCTCSSKAHCHYEEIMQVIIETPQDESPLERMRLVGWADDAWRQGKYFRCPSIPEFVQHPKDEKQKDPT